jgi:predicted PurR-regulated permease PerM
MATMKQTTERPEDGGRIEPIWPVQRAGALVLVAVTLVALYVCFQIALPLLPALAWALALAVIAYPLHRRIAQRVRPPSLAAGVSLCIVVMIFFVPAAFVLDRIVVEVYMHLERLNAEAAAGQWDNLGERSPFLASLVAFAGKHFDIRAETQRFLSFVLANLPSLVKASLWTLFEVLMTVFALFYFLRDGERGLAGLREALPLTPSECDDLFHRVGDVIHGTVYGTLLCAAVQGALGGLMFWWLGLPAPTLWGVVMGLLAIVPYLGAFVIWAPAALFLAIDGHWGSALILALWGGVVIALIDNLIYPVLVGKRMHLHPLLVFIGIMGGLVLFGASGVIVGPIVLALAQGLLILSRRRFLPEPPPAT